MRSGRIVGVMVMIFVTSACSGSPAPPDLPRPAITSASPMPSASPSASTSPPVPAGWSSELVPYVDPRGAFSVGYPPGWYKVRDAGGSSFYVVTFANDRSVRKRKAQLTDVKLSFQFGVAQSFGEVADYLRDGHDIEVAGSPGRYRLDGPIGMDDPYRLLATALVERGDRRFLVRLISGDAEDETLFFEVLDTVRFH